ncbi:NADP oxidoreductase, partial [Mycobacterium timonense]
MTSDSIGPLNDDRPQNGGIEGVECGSIGAGTIAQDVARHLVAAGHRVV